MADELHVFEFRDGRPPRYPWDMWLNGSPWRVHPGRDFHCTVATFQRAARDAGRRRGVNVRTGRDGSAIVIQAVAADVEVAA